MKKFLSILFFFAGLTVVSFAAPVGSEDALEIARTFYQTRHNSLLRSTAADFKLVYAATEDDRATRSAGGERYGYYYIFNVGENDGFVIVAGDDCVTPVLGYSTEGAFRTDNVPENIRFWMDGYKEQIKRVADRGGMPAGRKNGAAAASGVVVEPLLGGIKWDQDAPYNGLCPEVESEKTVTGCVATALAQVMRYHRWPERGTGSFSYVTPTYRISCSADFENTTYDWANMRESYTPGHYTEEQAAAVATLMYHCGVASKMDYNLAEKGGSGATFIDAAMGVLSYFGYDRGLQLYYRDYCPEGEWVNLLKKEIDEGRPVFYTGVGNQGGHAFVCDGYTGDDMFHFNWGWSGSCDGYFEVGRLDPLTPGIGGGSGGFNEMQAIIAGLKKPAENTVTDYQLMMLGEMSVSPSSIGREGVFTFNTACFNAGIHTWAGICAAGIFSGDELREVIPMFSIERLDPYAGWNEYGVELSIPPSVEPGSYRMCMVYTEDEGNNWMKVHAPVGIPSYYNVEVTDKRVEFSYGSPGCILELSSPLEAGDEFYAGREGTFRIPVENKGEYYYSYVALQLEDASGNKVMLTPSLLNLADGANEVLEFTGILPGEPGEYKVTAWYDKENRKRKNFTMLTPSGHNILIIHINRDPSALAEHAADRLRIYPVPVADRLTVECGSEIESIWIYTLNGRLLQQFDAGGKKRAVISVNGLQPGYYMLKIETAAGLRTQTFIKG